MKNKKVYAIDIDGVVADGKFWVDECTPRQKELDAVNKLYMEGNTIIYHTGRHPKYYEITYAWLVKVGAYFHALEMGKLTADVYIDDRNMSVAELLKEPELSDEKKKEEKKPDAVIKIHNGRAYLHRSHYLTDGTLAKYMMPLGADKEFIAKVKDLYNCKVVIV